MSHVMRYINLRYLLTLPGFGEREGRGVRYRGGEMGKGRGGKEMEREGGDG